MEAQQERLLISVVTVAELYAGVREGEERSRLERFLDRLGTAYGYKDLFALKDLFAPRWQPRYLALPSDRSLPRVALALADVHTTRGLRQLLRRSL